MNILYCGDSNIADGVLISLLSLLKSAKEAVNVYILTASIKNGNTEISALSQDYADFLDKTAKEFGAENSVKLLDITNLFENDLPLANMDTRFTPCCMLRLYCDLVDGLPDKILYLDNDVICRKNPDEFYEQDMGDFELAGVLDYYGSWFFYNRPFKREYLNSGVLLLNIKKIKQTELFKKCRDMCRCKKMFMPDQSAINKLSKHKKICNRKYNEQRKLHGNTVFQHFTTSFRFLPWLHTVSVKPWNIDGMHQTLKLFEYDNLLISYQQYKDKYQKERINL